MLKTHTIYECNIDLRHVKCACDNPDCKIGLYFDSNPPLMMLIDMYGNDHAMHVNKENIDEAIDGLRQLRREVVKNNKNKKP